MIDIRRIFTHVEQIRHEFGPVAPVPLLRGAIGVVLTNPFAGRYEPEILPMMAALDPVGLKMARKLLAAMDVPAERIGLYILPFAAGGIRVSGASGYGGEPGSPTLALHATSSGGPTGNPVRHATRSCR